MESFLPAGGFQLPFQKRLSRLYNDTKQSSDFVKEPVRNEDDPEIKILHRKLRIQKDRLVSWGLEWSDPTQSAEIDESLSKAGLSEVVGSIMSTIKDILAEAEPLWLSSKRIIEPSQPAGDRKAPLIQWNKNRFEDLVNDLTTSIDTLYDLSRTRSLGAMPRRSSKTPFKSSIAEEHRPFESSRMQTPQQIDPKSLTYLQSKRGVDADGRQVVLMSKMAYSELPSGLTRQPWAPLLLEYATFDSIYSITGIMPPSARFEKLSAGLQQDSQRSPGTWTGLPRLLGYFEDMENSRLGLIYRLPQSFNAVAPGQVAENAVFSLPTLSSLISKPGAEPRLEAKFRLAHNLANTVFDLHARGITHGNLVDENISFCDIVNTHVDGDYEVDIRRPLISSFDVFPDESPSGTSLSRHPLDPRNVPTSPLVTNGDQRVLDLYSLAMLLLSVGLWAKLETLLPDPSSTSILPSLFDQLAIRCGTLYMKAVQCCWNAVDEELAGQSTGDALLAAVQVKVSRFLEACSILDGVTGLEDRMEHEVEEAGTKASSKATSDMAIPRDRKDSKTSFVYPRDSAPTTPLDSRDPNQPPVGTSGTNNDDLAIEKPDSKPEKMRLYPHVPLAPEAVEKWNKVLMPQINQALKGFYRKNPESVEISLESVGPSPHKTTPTVLVVCTSVGKVRSILKKRIGDLFDDTTGFSLKVCRGQVIRSRKHSAYPLRSMARRSRTPKDNGAEDDENDQVEAVNPEYQERPSNGASIGAWIGDRHLPPVSLGGLVLVNGNPYGMTVHHMLDDPERDSVHADASRSSAFPGREWNYESFDESSIDDEFAYDLSDTMSETFSDTDITSDDDDDEYDEDEDEFEPGDMVGVEPDMGEGYIITQPALDDVEEGFYPDSETQDEDHLDTYTVGEVYASSGIRRKQANGLVHEVDWALFRFSENRLPEDNLIPLAEQGVSQRQAIYGEKLMRPTTVTPSDSLPGMEVQCMARSSGLQRGKILPALTSVKIYGRISPSQSYQVTSSTSSEDERVPLGIPGDSGAWIVGREDGQVCGHVLAWSQRKRVAYICPMEVLLVDIAETLETNEVRLPGGQAISITGKGSAGTGKGVSYPQQIELPSLVTGEEADKEGKEGVADENKCAAQNPISSSQPRSAGSSRCASEQGSSSPVQFEASGELASFTRRVSSLNIRNGPQIGVSG